MTPHPNPTDRFLGKLFWKLLLALWLSVMVSILMTGLYLSHFELIGPPPPGMKTIGLFPLVPLLSGMLAMLLVGLAVAWYLVVPLRHLREGLREVARGRFDRRVMPLMGRRKDEITDLAHDFDCMAEQLQQLTQARQTLLHDISHEMRSPLARMKAAIGLLQQDPLQTTVMLERIVRESDRMDALVEELLTLHRLEASPQSWSLNTMDVVELLQSVAEDADFEAQAVARRVSMKPSSVRFVAQVQGELLCRAFENVIRNAVKYTAVDTTVEIHVENPNGDLCIAVEDRGLGVASEDLERIFEPFTRIEATAYLRGTGLGLAIARRALAIHGGQITARNRADGGLTISMHLPQKIRVE